MSSIASSQQDQSCAQPRQHGLDYEGRFLPSPSDIYQTQLSLNDTDGKPPAVKRLCHHHHHSGSVSRLTYGTRGLTNSVNARSCSPKRTQSPHGAAGIGKEKPKASDDDGAGKDKFRGTSFFWHFDAWTYHGKSVMAMLMQEKSLMGILCM